jgi:hypothetical protein
MGQIFWPADHSTHLWPGDSILADTFLYIPLTGHLSQIKADDDDLSQVSGQAELFNGGVWTGPGGGNPS